jgi:hypothetical protein
MEIMADPAWIRKTIILSFAFAVPAAMSLIRIWMKRHKNDRAGMSSAFWISVIVLSTFVAWALNVTIEFSVGLMVAWPICGIILSIVGCASSLRTTVHKTEPTITNALLLVLSLACIVAPN